MLEKTDSLINDVLELLTKIDNNFPSVTNEYLVKIALIYFNLDVETTLKEWLKNNNNLISIISEFNNIRNFCEFYKTNFNNPNTSKLKAIYDKFGLTWPELDDSEVTAYNNIITARNDMNHDPFRSLKVNFTDIQGAFIIAEKILNPFK